MTTCGRTVSRGGMRGLLFDGTAASSSGGGAMADVRADANKGDAFCRGACSRPLPCTVAPQWLARLAASRPGWRAHGQGAVRPRRRGKVCGRFAPEQRVPGRKPPEPSLFCSRSSGARRPRLLQWSPRLYYLFEYFRLLVHILEASQHPQLTGRIHPRRKTTPRLANASHSLSHFFAQLFRHTDASLKCSINH